MVLARVVIGWKNARTKWKGPPTNCTWESVPESLSLIDVWTTFRWNSANWKRLLSTFVFRAKSWKKRNCNSVSWEPASFAQFAISVNGKPHLVAVIFSASRAPKPWKIVVAQLATRSATRSFTRFESRTSRPFAHVDLVLCICCIRCIAIRMGYFLLTLFL